MNVSAEEEINSQIKYPHNPSLRYPRPPSSLIYTYTVSAGCLLVNHWRRMLRSTQHCHSNHRRSVMSAPDPGTPPLSRDLIVTSQDVLLSQYGALPSVCSLSPTKFSVHFIVHNTYCICAV